MLLRAGGSWRAARRGLLLPASRVRDLNWRLGLNASACMHGATRIRTWQGEEDVLDSVRKDPDDEEDALAARRLALFRPSSPWTSIAIHRGQAPS